MNKSDDSKLELFLEDKILIKYNINSDINLHWIAHIKVDENTTIHLLIQDDCNYTIISQKEQKDISGLIDDSVSLCKVGSNGSEFILISGDNDNSGWYVIYWGWPQKYYKEF